MEKSTSEKVLSMAKPTDFHDLDAECVKEMRDESELVVSEDGKLYTIDCSLVESITSDIEGNIKDIINWLRKVEKEVKKMVERKSKFAHIMEPVFTIDDYRSATMCFYISREATTKEYADWLRDKEEEMINDLPNDNEFITTVKNALKIGLKLKLTNKQRREVDLYNSRLEKLLSTDLMKKRAINIQ